MKIKKSVISKAVKEAKKSNVDRGKIGAVLFTNSGNVVCAAHNTRIYSDFHFTIHAEIYLLAKALRMKVLDRIDGVAGILVVRYRPMDKSLAMAKPCFECACVLRKTGLPVYYTDYNGKIARL